MRNLIIAGGGLVNKGAQAMTLISICELKKRYPDHRILLLAWDVSPEAQKHHAMYDLKLLQVPPIKFAQAAKDPLKRALFSLRYGKAFREIDEIYRNTDLLLDISGYALGSNWSAKVCHDYLDNIEFALAYDIPVYLMPQSFGPFCYQDEAGRSVDARTRRLLPQVRQIFAREQEGYDALITHYGLSNVTLSKDLVLTSTIHDYTGALREQVLLSLPEMPECSMCVIPNVRVGDSGTNDILALYQAAVTAGLEQGLTVYITHHSTQDIDLCVSLKALFAQDNRVILLDRDHSCIEFNELVKQFRFLVASRFHALVHALKNGIPCVALGWAVKYHDLMNLFDQGAYVFDLREETDPESIRAAVIAMNTHFSAESHKIRHVLPALQQENVFDWIETK